MKRSMNMQGKTFTMELAGKTLTIETGKYCPC